MAVGDTQFSATTGAAVALTASTAKSVIGIRPPTSGLRALKLTEIGVSFDATDATKAPVLVELCKCTFATNAPGTNSTSLTAAVISGHGITYGGTAARNWTAEPTVLTAVKEWQIDSNKGQLIIQYPLGREPEAFDFATPTNSHGYVIRCTSGTGSTPNVRAYIEWEGGGT